MTPRRILAYGLAATLAAGLLAAFPPPFFATLDLKIYDAAVRAAPTRPPSGRVAIVAVDDRSLSEIGQWPWSRDVMADLLDRIRLLGGRVTAIDMLLAEPDRFNPAPAPDGRGSDSALAASIGRSRTVMSYAFTFEPEREGAGSCLLHPLDLALVDPAGRRAAVDDLFRATGVICSLPTLTRAASASGFVNAAPDRDGILRRIPLVAAMNGRLYPSLALAAVREAAQGGQAVLVSLPGRRAELVLDRVRVPLDERGTLLVRFRGRRATYPSLSASDVLRGRVSPRALQDRIVFVGATALGIRDVVATPVDTALPGIEVHASAADTLLQQDFLATPSYARTYELAATLICGMTAAALVAVVGYVYGTALAALMLGVLWWATFVGVAVRGLFLSPLYPTMATLLAVLALTVSRMRHERHRAEAERERRERVHHLVVQSLTSLMETRDGITGQHARRTQEYSRVLASRLATLHRFREYLTPERVELISRLSPLHDIGKVGIRDAVLNKPGPLSAEEADEMRTHPQVGHETIAKAERLAGLASEADAAILQLAKDIVYTHHERWDGLGYPRGLKGDAIPVAGRIVALVDVYDALSHTRSYRTGLTHEQAVETIALGRGTHFDPDVVDAFIAVEPDFRQLRIRFADTVSAGD